MAVLPGRDRLPEARPWLGRRADSSAAPEAVVGA